MTPTYQPSSTLSDHTGSAHPAPDRNEVSGTPGGSIELTRSQRAVSSELEHSWALRDAPGAAGITVRRHRLIVGFSGSGKTFCARDFARRQGVSLHCISVGSWIVAGAHGPGHTLRDVAEALARHPEGMVILIDELDKFTATIAGSQGWFASVLQEVLALLDGDDRLCRHGFHEFSRAALGRSLVLGAGAWQALQREGGAVIAGFGAAAVAKTPSAADQADLVARRSGLNEELFSRFNDELLVVEPPDAVELRTRVEAMHADLGLPAPAPAEVEGVVARALVAVAPMRSLEGHLGRLLRETPGLVVSRQDAPAAHLAAPGPGTDAWVYPMEDAPGPGYGYGDAGASWPCPPQPLPAWAGGAEAAIAHALRRRLVRTAALFRDALDMMSVGCLRLEDRIARLQRDGNDVPAWLLWLPGAGFAGEDPCRPVQLWLEEVRGMVDACRERRSSLEDLTALLAERATWTWSLARARRGAPAGVAGDIEILRAGWEDVAEMAADLGFTGGPAGA